MELRQAKAEDTDIIADLMIKSFYDNFRILFGKETEKGKAALKEYLKDGKSLQSIFVAVENKKIVGVLGLKIKETQQNWDSVLKIFIKNLGLLKGLKAILLGNYLQLSFEKDKCLVDYCCVSKEFRHRGIGIKLIEYGEKFAINMHKKYMYGFFNPQEDLIHQGYKMGYKKKFVKKSVISKIFFNKPVWIYIEKKIN